MKWLDIAFLAIKTLNWALQGVGIFNEWRKKLEG